MMTRIYKEVSIWLIEKIGRSNRKKKKKENLANRCSYSYEKHVYKKKSYEKHVIVRLVMNGFA